MFVGPGHQRRAARGRSMSGSPPQPRRVVALVRALRRRIGIAVLGVAAGQLAAAPVYQPRFPADHIAAAPMHVRLRLDAVLVADPEVGADRARLWLSARQIDEGRGWRPAHGY